jgi:trans-aconitate methyltransferase
MIWDPGLYLKCAGERMRSAVDLVFSNAALHWLVPWAESVDLWTTEYLHLLPAGDGIEHPVVAVRASVAGGERAACV